MIATDAADGLGLKITKAGGLTPSRRQRDICRAAGLVMSVQDTVGSTLSFAALAHLGSTVPPHLLRCILDVRDMVTLPVGRSMRRSPTAASCSARRPDWASTSTPACSRHRWRHAGL